MKKFYPVFLVVALAALAIAATFWRGQNQPALPAEQPITPDTAPVSTMDWRIYETYEVGGSKLFYEPDEKEYYYVDVFIQKDGGNKEKIIDNVPIDGPGGSMPQFKGTSNSNIVLLTISSGDMGWFWTKDYYVDIKNKLVRSISIGNRKEIHILNGDNSEDNIEIGFSRECEYELKKGVDGYDQSVLKSGSSAVLDGIKFNNKIIDSNFKNTILQCDQINELGSGTNPSPELNIYGINKNLDKLYFSLMPWEEKYVYDISQRNIAKAEPNDLLMIVKD